MKNLRIALLTLGALALMAAGVLINGNQINPASNISIWNLAATYGVTGSTGTFTGALSALSGAFSGGVTASSGTFTATGTGQYSVQASSSILVQNGTVNAPYFIGNGSLLTGIVAQIWSGGTVANTSTFQSSVTVQGNFGAPTINSSSTYSGTGTITNAWSWLSGSSITMGSGSAFNLQAGSTATFVCSSCTITGTPLIENGYATGNPAATQSAMSNVVHTFWLKSVDGVTQSSGTAMAYQMSGNTGGSDFLEITSTTTTGLPFCILQATCVPGTMCLCASGVVRANAITTCAAGDQVTTTTTRGQLTGASGSIGTGAIMGVCLTSSAAGGPGYVSVWAFP